MVGHIIKLRKGYELHVVNGSPSSDRESNVNAYLNAQVLVFGGMKEVRKYCAENNITPWNF